jgi:hypothetical protein
LSHGLIAQRLTRSPITGPAGNVEFLAWFQKGAEPHGGSQLLDAVFPTKGEAYEA